MAPRGLALLLLLAAASTAAAHAASPPSWLRAIRDAAAAAAPRAAAPLRDVIKPSTPVWPELFSAVLFQNRTGNLALTSLYYDWKRGRNLNLIQTQLGARGEVWDLEHDNGTSYIFSRTEPLCKVLKFDVGILVPDWLANATLLGTDTTDGFVTDVWTKADFINYYNDNATDRPVRWTFLSSGGEFHVMKWSPGDALSDAHWQAPAWCFNASACVVDARGGGGGGQDGGQSGQSNPEVSKCPPSILDHPSATGRLMRPPAPAAAAMRRGGSAHPESSAAAAAVAGLEAAKVVRRPQWWMRGRR